MKPQLKVCLLVTALIGVFMIVAGGGSGEGNDEGPSSSPSPASQSQKTPPWFEGITLVDAIQMGHWDAFLFRLSAGDNATLIYPRGATLFHYAAERGETRMVRHFVEQLGWNVTAVDDQGLTPLHHASSSCHTETIKYLVEAAPGASAVDAKNTVGDTPLAIAAGYSCSKSISFLVEAGADVNGRRDSDFAQHGSNNSPLHRALTNDYMPAIFALVEGGADLKVRNKAGQSPLHYRVSECGTGRLSEVQYLISKGADVNPKDDKGDSPLHTAVGNNCSLSLVQFLVESGADPRAKNNLNLTALEVGIMEMEEESSVSEYLTKVTQNPVQFLTSTTTTETSRTNIPHGNNYRYYPLFDAVREGDLDAVRYRVSVAGDNVSAVDHGGYLPIHIAVVGGHLPVVKYFVEELGVEVDPKSTRIGDTTVGVAAGLLKSTSILEYLVGKGGKLETADFSGNTPLHTAVSSNYLEPVEYLVTKAGANLNAKNMQGQTPLHVAARGCRFPAVYTLVEGGADLSVTDRDGNTPLHSLVSSGGETPRLGAVQFLVEKGAEVTAVNEDGDTPLHLLAARSTTDDVMNIVEYLVNRGAELEARNLQGKRAVDLSSDEDIKALITSIRNYNL